MNIDELLEAVKQSVVEGTDMHDIIEGIEIDFKNYKDDNESNSVSGVVSRKQEPLSLNDLRFLLTEIENELSNFRGDLTDTALIYREKSAKILLNELYRIIDIHEEQLKIILSK